MITGLGHTPLAETYLELSSFKGDDKIELDNENNEKLCAYLHLVSAKLTGFNNNYNSLDIY